MYVKFLYIYICMHHCFVAINLLDLIVGMIAGILKEIRRKAKDKRILKGLSKDNADE